MSAVLFFIAAIGAISGAIGVVTLRNPFYSVLALAFHLVSLAALFLLLRAEFVAVGQVIVYAGAVMVLYVFVVAYVGGGEPLASGAVLRVLGPLFALALAIELSHRDARLGAEGDQGQGRALRLRFRHPRPDRPAAPDQVPVPVRGRLDPAAARRRRRGRAGAPPARARRATRSRRCGSGQTEPDYTGTMAEAAGVRPTAYDELLHPEVEPVPRPPRPGADPHRGLVVAIGWYLVVSAMIFCIGAGGVLARRNPLVILLCLELMLNGANLALVAFARMWGGEDGQVFALIVMVVAAAEVTVGLGLIVALYRRRLPIDVDELSELHG